MGGWKKEEGGCPESAEKRRPFVSRRAKGGSRAKSTGRNSACAVGASRPRLAPPRRSPRGRAWRRARSWEAGRREQPRSLVDLRVDEGVMTDTSLLTGGKHVLLSRTRAPSKECPTLLPRSRSSSEARDPPDYLGGSTARGVYRRPLAVLSRSSRDARASCAPEGSRQHARAQASRVAGREWHTRARRRSLLRLSARPRPFRVVASRERERESSNSGGGRRAEGGSATSGASMRTSRARARALAGRASALPKGTA